MMIGLAAAAARAVAVRDERPDRHTSRRHLRAVIPFIVALLLVLTLVTFVPALTLFVPRAFGYL